MIPSNIDQNNCEANILLLAIKRTGTSYFQQLGQRRLCSMKSHF